MMNRRLFAAALLGVIAIWMPAGAETVRTTTAASASAGLCPNTRQELASDADDTILATSGKVAVVNNWTTGRNINLPTAASYVDSAGNGCTLVINDEVGTWSLTHVATLVRAGSDTINGGNTYTSTAPRGALILRSNAKPALAGSGWVIDGADIHQSYDCSPGEQVAQTESAAGATTCADPAVQLIYQNNIPLIIPSSGTIGNNGALSALTALPTTFASCFMYFPASKIVAGSAAGFYFVQMSSTTAGTIFNNTYTPGTPAVIPPSPTAFVTTGPGAYTQTTSSDIAMVSTSVGAGTIGINGSLRATSLFEYPTNANNKTIKANLGGTIAAGLLTGGTSFESRIVTTTTAREAITTIRNQGAANVQISNGSLDAGAGASSAVRGTVDTTSAQNLILSGNLATATDYLVLEGATVEKIH